MKLNHAWHHKSRSEALRHARAEKRRHKLGRGWKIYVHDNMGWFWKCVNGPNVSVSPFAWNGKVESYTCYLGENRTGTYTARGRTPQTAVNNTYKVAKPSVAWYLQILKEARRVAQS